MNDKTDNKNIVQDPVPEVAENPALQARVNRILDAANLKQPDRVPIYFSAAYWPGRYHGMTCKEITYDKERYFDAIKKTIIEFQPDAQTVAAWGLPTGPVMDMMGLRNIRWPGSPGVSDDVSFQYLDKELMTADEYDEFIFDPTGFMIHKYLPRVAEVFEPFSDLPYFPGLFYNKSMATSPAYATPQMREAFETLAKAGEYMQDIGAGSAQLFKEIMDEGIPPGIFGVSQAPFDVIADYLRGSKGAMLDMFRNKDKLLAAIDKMTQIVIRDTLVSLKSRPTPPLPFVFFPLHWGLDGFMSPEQFETFFWPSLRKVGLAVADAGYIPHFFWEGRVDSRLDIIKDIPKGKFVYMFEATDIFNAKKVLGDTVCLKGNMPGTLLVAGKPEQIIDYTKRLIDEVGKDGGFILDGAITGIPDDSKAENVKAWFKTAHEYGKY